MSKDFHKLLFFLIISCIWGTTWLAAKLTLLAVPPLFAGGLRFILAGAILLGLAALKGEGPQKALRQAWGGILLVGFFLTFGYFGLGFWGVQFVPSGLYSVINFATIPVGLYALGLALGEEPFSRRRVLALALGVLGLFILFWPRLGVAFERDFLLGMAAIILASLVFCFGSIKSRKVMQRVPIFTLSGYQALFGGIMMAFATLVFEKPSFSYFTALLAPEPLLAFLFMTIFGSVIAYSLYFYLVREWGAGKAGLFALVAPIVAVLVGVFLYNEPFGAYEAVGSLFMLGAAFVMLRAKRAAPGAAPPKPVKEEAAQLMEEKTPVS